jgi:hypothetical protein
MHVNTYFKGTSYPTDSFLGQDPYPFIQHLFNPLYPLSEVAYHQSLDWDAGTSWQKDVTGNYPSDTPEIPGQRALLAILDEADAAAFQFPTAAIPNAAGDYVQPTNASMTAALADMTSNGSGAEQVNLNNTNPAAYPLTMVIYAAVPTACTPPSKASAIARFLDYAAGAGQVQGDQPGELPAGYLPLPASMRAQTDKAASEVAHQGYDQAACQAAEAASQTVPGLSSTGFPTALPSTPGPSPSAQSTAVPSPTPAQAPSITEQLTTTTIADPQQAADTRYVFPALLLLGGLAALAGSSALMASARTSALALLRTRVPRIRPIRRRKP